jgi:hypothetical protein
MPTRRRSWMLAAVLSVAAAVGPAAQPADAPDRYDLTAAERLGGHTLARHVGRTDAQLRDRLRREKNVSAASTYDDREVA